MRSVRGTSVRAMLVAIAVLLMAGSASGIPYTLGCTGQNDVDTAIPTIVSCVASPPVSGLILDIDVQLNIDDLVGTPYASDLVITLTHVPSAITVTLYTGDQVLNPSALLNVTLDDAAAAPVPTQGDAVGTFQPGGNLSDFNGVDVSGTWQLSIQDPTTWTDEGIDLLSWSLVTTIVPEPNTGILLSGGLIGLAISGRSRRSR